jgi:hypothetical protein
MLNTGYYTRGKTPAPAVYGFPLLLASPGMATLFTDNAALTSGESMIEHSSDEVS